MRWNCGRLCVAFNPPQWCTTPICCMHHTIASAKGQQQKKNAYNGHWSMTTARTKYVQKKKQKTICTRYMSQVSESMCLFFVYSELLNAPPIAFSFIDWKKQKWKWKRKRKKHMRECTVAYSVDRCSATVMMHWAATKSGPKTVGTSAINACVNGVLCVCCDFSRWRETFHTLHPMRAGRRVRVSLSLSEGVIDGVAGCPHVN